MMVLQEHKCRKEVTDERGIVKMSQIIMCLVDAKLDGAVLSGNIYLFTNMPGKVELRCSAQTWTGMGHLRKPPGVELIPAVD
jgi:hypothetical protein